MITTLLASLLLVAQGASKDRGYISAKFMTTDGGITIYLPNDIAPGDRITGSVFTDNNSDTFKGMSITIGGVAGSPVRAGSKLYTWTVPTSAKNGCPLIVTSKLGNQLGAIRIGVTPAPEPLDAFTFPNFVQTGRPAVIYGPFDGNSSNTRLTLGKSDASILAESPRSMTVYVPYDSGIGATQAKLVENNKRAETEIRTISVELDTPKQQLKQGDTTLVTLKVEGMTGLSESNVPFIQVQNLTPKVLDLDGQTIHAVIPKVGKDGTYQRAFKAKSLNGGSFLLTTFVEPGPGIPVLPH